MFCSIETTETHIIVKPTRLGMWIRKVTRGRILPSVTLKRDFGTGCFDGRCLSCEWGINVTLYGNLISGKRPEPVN